MTAAGLTVTAGAWAAGAAAMREMAERGAGDFLMLRTGIPVEVIVDVQHEIRALPIPPMLGTTQGGNADE